MNTGRLHREQARDEADGGDALLREGRTAGGEGRREMATDDGLALIMDTGGAVSVTPETKLQMGMGFPLTGRLPALGLWPSLAIEIV